MIKRILVLALCSMCFCLPARGQELSHNSYLSMFRTLLKIKIERDIAPDLEEASQRFNPTLSLEYTRYMNSLREPNKGLVSRYLYHLSKVLTGSINPDPDSFGKQGDNIRNYLQNAQKDYRLIQKILVANSSQYAEKWSFKDNNNLKIAKPNDTINVSDVTQIPFLIDFFDEKVVTKDFLDFCESEKILNLEILKEIMHIYPIYLVKNKYGSKEIKEILRLGKIIFRTNVWYQKTSKEEEIIIVFKLS